MLPYFLMKSVMTWPANQSLSATQKGLEPSTSAVTGRRSNQLSHWAICTLLVDLQGLEPRPDRL